MNTEIAAYIFAFLMLLLVLFQLALAAGMPWGSLAMGGKFPGRFPVKLRIAAIVQATIAILFSLLVISRAGLLLPSWQESAGIFIWVVVGFSVLSTVMNIITPSKWERIIWAPVAVTLTICSLIVALS